MMLRSMKQAKYDIRQRDTMDWQRRLYALHFANPSLSRLNRPSYDSSLRKTSRSFIEERRNASEDKLQQIADQSSRMERLAVQAERDVNALKKAEYMQDKVGEEFDGIVSSVTKFGMFVELANTVEGLIHISHLKQDYF